MGWYTQVAEIRDCYADAVRTNQVLADSLWNQPCLAFSVQIPVTRAAADELCRLQEALALLEPHSLHCCPPETLHISTLLILAARETYHLDKRAYWQEIGAACIAALSDTAQHTEQFVVRFRAVVPTNTAVIVVAEDDGQMARLRRRLAQQMPIPPKTGPVPDIIHTTICRYKSQLADPVSFEAATRHAEPLISMPVERLGIREEQVYPSLASVLVCEQWLRKRAVFPFPRKANK